MIQFPILKESQVALIRVERNTGIVLDVDLKWAISNDQETYTAFDNYDLALAFAIEIENQNPQIEVAIYSSNQEVLFYSNKK